jgi:hypothetical protein
MKLRGARGSFAQVSPSLAWLSYDLTAGAVRLAGEPPLVDGRPAPLFVRHGGPKADAERYHGTVRVDAGVGDVVICDDFQVYLG